jgi:hypothetical protein
MKSSNSCSPYQRVKQFVKVNFFLALEELCARGFSFSSHLLEDVYYIEELAFIQAAKCVSNDHLSIPIVFNNFLSIGIKL